MEKNSLLNHPRLNWICAGLLLVVSWAIFSNTLSHGYAWDDSISITSNPRTLAGLEGVPDHFQFRSRYELADFNGYRPVALTSLSLDIELFGMDPQAAHGMQVLYFSLLVLVVFFTLQRLFPQAHPLYPFLAALLFAVHPLHVEVVANLKSRDELLGLLFGMLALNMFVRYIRRPHIGTGLASFALLLLGILSKENTITFLGVFVVVSAVLGENRCQRLIGVGSVAGLLVLVLGAFLVLTGRAPGASPEETTPAFIENMVVSNSHATPMGLGERLMNSGHLYLLYLRNYFVPTDLVYHSGYNHIPVLTGFSLLGIWGLLTLAGTPLLALWAAVRQRYTDLVLGFFLFFLPLSIYLQILVPLPDTLADRFMFAPTVGLSWLVVMGIRRWMGWSLGKVGAPGPEVAPKQKNKPPKVDPQWKRQAGLGAGGILLLAAFWGYLAVDRNPVWADNLSLFRADMEALNDDGKAHYYLATELMVRYGNDPLRGAEQQEAVQHYYEAIEKSPFLFYARLELGDYLVNHGRAPEGLKVLAAARNKFPDHPDPHFYHGKAALEVGALDTAVASFQRVLELMPEDKASRELLGKAYGRQGNFAAGLQVANEVLASEPRNVQFLEVRSSINFEKWQQAGDSLAMEAAFRDLHRVIEIQPGVDLYWKKLIGWYQLKGDHDRAGVIYQDALSRGILSPQ